MSMYLNDKQFDEVMSKLFKTIGKKFYSINQSCRDEDWFMQSSWTQTQEKGFEKWLIKYVIKKLHIPIKLAKGMVKIFCFNYGWKYE